MAETRPSLPAPSPVGAPPKRRRRGCLLTLLLVALGTWFAHEPVLHALARWLIVGQQPPAAQVADAIVPLGGADVRKRYALELYRRGAARDFVLIFNEHEEYGVPFGRAGRVPEIARRHLVEGGYVKSERLHILRRLTSTYEEAVRLRALVREREWQTLLVVDCPFHTRRTRWVFRRVFGEDADRIRIVPVPFSNPDPAFDPPACIVSGLPTPDARASMSVRHWWTRERELLFVFEEYVKFVLYLWKY